MPPDTDFTKKVMDIHPDGTSALVTEGIQRARFREGLDKEVFMQDSEVYQLRIDLGHIAWRFAQGHKIAVDISSRNFPQWDRNLNTKATLSTTTESNIANNLVHHGGLKSSFIELPVVKNLHEFEKLCGFKTFDNQ